MITCQGHTWNVHKVIGVAASAFFKAAVCGGFSEANTSVVNLPEDTPMTVARLILQMYSRTYPFMSSDGLKLQSRVFEAELADVAAPGNDH
jgi:hypothetical protein